MEYMGEKSFGTWLGKQRAAQWRRRRGLPPIQENPTPSTPESPEPTTFGGKLGRQRAERARKRKELRERWG